jgi:hypothetical protein
MEGIKAENAPLTTLNIPACKLAIVLSFGSLIINSVVAQSQESYNWMVMVIDGICG